MKNNLPGLPINAKEELQKELAKLEGYNTRQQGGGFKFFLLIILVVVPVVFIINIGVPLVVIIAVTCVALIILFLFYKINNQLGKIKIEKTFKTKIIQKILVYLLPGVSYNPSENLTASNLRGSRVLAFYANRATGEDLFEGKRGSTTFKFSEINAEGFQSLEEFIHGNYGSDSPTTFNGLLIKCKVSVAIKKSIRIFSATIDDGFAKNKGMENLSSDVDNKFSVYGFKGEQYALVLNERFLNQLANIEDLFGANIFVSIFPKSAHIAIATKHNYFEPNLKKSINLDQVERIYNEIVKCLMVVDVFDQLNMEQNNLRAIKTAK